MKKIKFIALAFLALTLGSCMGDGYSDITIGGLLYRLASTQISELLVQKLPIECRRVVEVDLMTFFLGHLRGIVII